MRTSAFLIAAAAVISVCSLRDARAEGSGIEVLSLTAKVPAADAKEDAVPMIEATIVGAPKLDAEKFFILDPNQKPVVELKGVSKRNYNQGTETLAVVIVMNGWELWIGNDKVLSPDDPSLRAGMLIELEAALDKLNFKDAGPPGSLGMVITYGDAVATRYPACPTQPCQMGPLQSLNGAALGTQNDYFKVQGSGLVKGIEQALQVLHNAKAARKVLIVIGDGCDINAEAAKLTLPNLKKQAQQEQIQTFAINKRIPESCEGPVVNQMITNISTVNQPADIAQSVGNILAKMDDRQYVTFKAFDREKDLGLNWDGKAHDLAIKVDKETTDTQNILLAPPWDAHPPKGFPWWIVAVVGGGLLLIIILGVAIFGGKKEVPLPAPMPMPVAAPVAAAEAPKPMGPAKTVMIGVGGDEGGFPVVGWLVPLNGPGAYQTFRLRSGGTKIGTAPPADIVINDGFMSTDHCMIQCTPQGFILVDDKSTNGSYVNDKRVQKHELVDNDTITLGKTQIKFKSIV